jgi:hypothetical protein
VFGESVGPRSSATPAFCYCILQEQRFELFNAQLQDEIPREAPLVAPNSQIEVARGDAVQVG